MSHKWTTTVARSQPVELHAVTHEDNGSPLSTLLLPEDAKRVARSFNQLDVMTAALEAIAKCDERPVQIARDALSQSVKLILSE